jgi:hypothetical protein
MEVLGALIRKANEWELLQSLGLRAIPFKASFYVDDLVLSFSSAPMNRISSCADRFLSFLRHLGFGLQREQMSNGSYSLQ